jgi:cytochrome c-type biogenesis protein CcmH
MDTVTARIETVRLDGGQIGMAAREKNTGSMRAGGDGNARDSKPLGDSVQPPGRARKPLIVIVALLTMAGAYYWLGTRSPTAPDVALDRQVGLALYRQGRYAEAVEVYERILATQDDPATRTSLANALKRLGRFDDAAKQFRTVLEKNPRDGGTWYDFGVMLQDDLRDRRSAIEVFRNATLHAPQMADAHLRLGVALLDLFDYEAAIAELQTALQLAPADAPWRTDAESALDVARLRFAESKGQLPPPRR